MRAARRKARDARQAVVVGLRRLERGLGVARQKARQAPHQLCLQLLRSGKPASAPLTRLVEVAPLHGDCNKRPHAASHAGVGSASSAPQTARKVLRQLHLQLLRSGDLCLHP